MILVFVSALTTPTALYALLLLKDKTSRLQVVTAVAPALVGRGRKNVTAQFGRQHPRNADKNTPVPQGLCQVLYRKSDHRTTIILTTTTTTATTTTTSTNESSSSSSSSGVSSTFVTTTTTTITIGQVVAGGRKLRPLTRGPV